jgi:AcrR family transcriptional regulator
MPSTKERILDSAMRLLDAGGPAAVTLRAVGDAAGISQSAPYRHCEDKRALLEAIVRANLGYFNSALDTSEMDARSPFAALDRVVRAYFEFAWRFPVRYRFLLEISREDSPLGAEVRKAFGAVTALVRTAQQAGELKRGDTDQISTLIFGAAYGMASLAQHGLSGVAPGMADAPDLAPLLLDLLRQGSSACKLRRGLRWAGNLACGAGASVLCGQEKSTRPERPAEHA